MHSKVVIGVDVGGTKIKIGKVISGKVVDEYTTDISANGSEEEIITEIITAIEKVYTNDVTGIGVGVPSLVDSEKGIVYHVQNIPSWEKVYLKDKLENHFHVPVYVNNDANCFAIGESYFNKGESFNSMVGLTIGTGLGAGIIIGKKLYSGMDCGAGEFGSINYLDGTYEDYVSGKYFENKHNIKGIEAARLADAGDVKALRLFEEFGNHLGEVIKSILFALSPEAIILGGSVTQSFKYFEGTMWKTIDSFPYLNTKKKLIVEPSENQSIAVLGAAALYYDAESSILQEVVHN